MNAETRASEDSETPFSLVGVAFISLALVIDAALINIQVPVVFRWVAYYININVVNSCVIVLPRLHVSEYTCTRSAIHLRLNEPPPY